MADKKLTDRSDEMEHDLNRLGDHISEAEKQLEARRKDANPAADVAGDWEGRQDRAGGDDPKGAAQDERQASPDGAPDDDDRVEAEVANPT